MLRYSAFLLGGTLLFSAAQAQNIGINSTGATPDASAMLDVASTTSGILIPRMTAAQRTGITSPAKGLLVYQTTGTPGPTEHFWYYDGTSWRPLFTDRIGWSTTGNAGTAVATNFLGTTDNVGLRIRTNNAERFEFTNNGRLRSFDNGTAAQPTYSWNGASAQNTGMFYPAASTLGFSSAGVERMRILSNGKVAVNSTTTFGTSTFYSLATGNNDAVDGNAAGTGSSVYGQNTGTGEGVYGLSVNGDGTWGVAQGDGGIGVVGITTGPAITANPVGAYGQSNNPEGFGQYARNTHNSGTALMVVGNGTAAGGTYLGTGTGAAVNGSKLGLISVGHNATAGNAGIGVVGLGNGPTTPIYTPDRGGGVVGIGVRYGIIGFASQTINTNPNNNSALNANNASAGGYFEVQQSGNAQTWAYVGVRDNTGTLRKIIGPGTVNTIVKDLDDNLVALSAPEAPENLFQDYGQGQLENGKAHIVLDPILSKNIVVNEEHPLRVFIQLEGDCNGVFVTNKSGNGFDVVELQGGTSNTPFMWSVVANRADETLPDGSISHYSAERFPPAPGALEKTEQKLARARVDIKEPRKAKTVVREDQH